MSTQAENVDELVDYLLGLESESAGIPIGPAAPQGSDDDTALPLEFDIDRLTPDETEDPGRVANPVDPVPFDDTLTARDERIESYDGKNGYEDIREFLRESGIAERVQQRLSDLFTGSRSALPPHKRRRDAPDIVGGRPDMRQVIRRFAGDLRVREVFRDTKPGVDDDLAVCCVLDLSGSMRGDAEHDAKAATGAFLFGVQRFGGEVTALSYPPNHIITSANERFRWGHLDAAHVRGGTPTRKAVDAGRQLLEDTSASRKLLIVLTDGGAADVHATRATVESVRDLGSDWAAIGFGFGMISEQQLSAQFGDDGYRHVDLDDLADALVDVYKTQHPGI